jgi:hypothetical protein
VQAQTPIEVRSGHLDHNRAFRHLRKSLALPILS